MNKRQKNKRIKIGSTAKQRRKNKELCERYPFLIPRNVWTDEICWVNKKYDNTLADDFPRGWWKAFGLMMCEELREELISQNYLDKFRVFDIKEKYGALKFYYGSAPFSVDNIENIIDKYSHLSENICIKCGKPDVPMINTGWYSPYCYDCFRNMIKYMEHYYYIKHIDNYVVETEDEIKDKYNKYICSKDHRMVDAYTVRHFSQFGNWDKIIDVSDTANKIRSHWEERNKNGSVR